MSHKTSSSKRKFCDHCGEFVSARTYRQHVQLYYNYNKGQWVVNDESSDEEVLPLSIEHDINFTLSGNTSKEPYSEVPLDNQETQQEQGITENTYMC